AFAIIGSIPRRLGLFLTTPPLAWRTISLRHSEHVLSQSVTAGPRPIYYSAAREAGTERRKPAASASSRKALTASRDRSAAVLLPSAGSFLRMSAGAVMI